MAFSVPSSLVSAEMEFLEGLWRNAAEEHLNQGDEGGTSPCVLGKI